MNKSPEPLRSNEQRSSQEWASIVGPVYELAALDQAFSDHKGVARMIVEGAVLCPARQFVIDPDKEVIVGVKPLASLAWRELRDIDESLGRDENFTVMVLFGQDTQTGKSPFDKLDDEAVDITERLRELDAFIELYRQNPGITGPEA